MAGISLAIMALGFLITLFMTESTAVFLLRGGFEAGLVGGIADWFAVTALFRHPLGIPIPHTSLLLKNKDKIIRSLISAVENELLNKESIEDKLRKFNMIGIVGKLATRLVRKRSVRLAVLEFLVRQVQQVPVEKWVAPIQGKVSGWIDQFDVKNAADKAVTRLIESKVDQKAFDFMAGEVYEWVMRLDTRKMLGKLANEKMSEVKMNGLMGFAFQAFAGFMEEDKLGGILQDMLGSTVRDMRSPGNAYRDKIIQEIRVRLFQLADDDERLGRLKDWAKRWVEGEDGQAFIESRLGDARDAALSWLEAERENGGRAVFAVYRYVWRRIAGQPEWIAAAEERVLAYVIGLVQANHFRIGQLVQDNLDQMDDAALVRMLEEKVGKDLQWIRVNGAVCGFLVGLVLSVIVRVV
jgi:uncharacterized membrane-anchored protein YjiN (DUF445 family)